MLSTASASDLSACMSTAAVFKVCGRPAVADLVEPRAVVSKNAAALLHIRVGLRDEVPHHVKVASDCRESQGSQAALACSARVHARLRDEELHHLEVARRRCNHQNCAAILGCLIHVHAWLRDKALRDLEVTIRSCIHQRVAATPFYSTQIRVGLRDKVLCTSYGCPPGVPTASRRSVPGSGGSAVAVRVGSVCVSSSRLADLSRRNVLVAVAARRRWGLCRHRLRVHSKPRCQTHLRRRLGEAALAVLSELLLFSVLQGLSVPWRLPLPR